MTSSADATAATKTMAIQAVKSRRIAPPQTAAKEDRAADADDATSDASWTKQKAAVVVQISAAQWGVIFALIFGGCCSNVFTLETIVKNDPQAGNLLTFVQFLFVAAEGYIHFFTPSRPPLFIAKPHVPYSRYAIIVTLFFLVSLLNNIVWKYHISVPVHIIFRSGGTFLSMVVGYICGKRYSNVQMLSVLILTAGVVSSTLFDAKTKNGGDDEKNSTNSGFGFGITVLFLAQVLSAVMSQVTESTFRKYGSHWRENLFYMHFLTLPLFLPVRNSITTEFSVLASSPSLPLIPPIFRQYLPSIFSISVPEQLFYLFLNAATQYLCVRGVNNLAGNATAVTVTIVLNVRKCVSLLLSIYIFGNKLSLGTCVGAALVFGGAGWYSIESSRIRERQKREATK
ncbi:UAA transporter [Limtongia smithiae]|uniref:UAA transporter n=1 Tax=Limtongia smithiae TaxID=1125753 RepID=UPI0034CFE629